MRLIYDGECPFCSRYVRLLRLRETVGQLQLINAREGGAMVADVCSRGYVIDEGMVLVMEGQYYYGDDCLNRLALLSSRQGWFNRLNYWLFKSPRLSRLSYPLLRTGRNAVLWCLGRAKLGF